MKNLFLLLSVLTFTFTSFTTIEQAEIPPISVDEIVMPIGNDYDNNYMGEIRLFPYTYAPRGWMKCDGKLLEVARHQALFSLLGSQYGGDGRTTFGLPNLNSPLTPDGEVGKELGFYCICISGIYPSRN